MGEAPSSGKTALKMRALFGTINGQEAIPVKKAWILSLILLCALTLCACGGHAGQEPPPTPTPDTAQAPGEPGAAPAPVETPAEAPAPTEEPVIPVEESAGPVEEPAAQTEEPGLPLTLTAEEQYEANIFLSNFSEQGFPSYPVAPDADKEAQLFRFAHLWAKINRRSAISYDGAFEVMSLESVNDILGRYFGEGISPADGTEYSAALGMGHFDWDRCWYAGGLFYYPAADGEAYNRFTVVDSAEALTGSRTRFRFTIYELDLDRYWDSGVIPGEYYRLTPEEAAQRAAAGEITPMRTGTAYALPCYLASSGRESYNLVSYTLDELD